MSAEALSSAVSRFGKSLATSRIVAQIRTEGLTRHQLVTYLENTRFLLRQTPRHLEQAARSAERIDQPELARFYRAKHREEQGHDRWAEADLRAIGAGDSTAAPLPGMQALVEYVTDVIERDPRLYLGYILFAEQLVVEQGPLWLDLIEQAGYPRPTALERHVQLDAGHAEEGKEVIRRFAPHLGSELLEVVREAGERFARYCDQLVGVR